MSDEKGGHFKAFEILEDTLQGSLDFTLGYLGGLWRLLRTPGHAGWTLREGSRGSMPRPLSFLALSSLGVALVIKHRAMAVDISSVAVARKIGVIAAELSVPEIVATTFWFVLVVYSFGLFLGRLLGQGDASAREQITKVVCYAFGTQFAMIFVTILSLLIWRVWKEMSGGFGRDWADGTLQLCILVLLPYSFVAAFLVLYRSFQLLAPRSEGNALLRVMAFWVFVFATYYAAVESVWIQAGIEGWFAAGEAGAGGAG